MWYGVQFGGRYMFRKSNSSLSFASKEQSVKGYLSVALAAVALLICAAAVIVSYVRKGNAGSIIGSCGIMAFLSAVMGFCFGIGGIAERDNARLLSWIGMLVSLILAAGLVVLFVSGL